MKIDISVYWVVKDGVGLKVGGCVGWGVGKVVGDKKW